MMAEQTVSPVPGCIFYFQLGQHLPPGHEQEGRRPALIVASPAAHGTPRFPGFIVVPLTTFRNQPWIEGSPALYPIIKARKDQIERDSVALLDQIRAADVTRVERYVGRLSRQEFQRIMKHLVSLFDHHEETSK